MDELQVWDGRAVERLVEQRGVFVCVEGGSFRTIVPLAFRRDGLVSLLFRKGGVGEDGGNVGGV